MNAKKNPDLVSGRLKGTPSLQGGGRGQRAARPTTYCRDRLGLRSEAEFAQHPPAPQPPPAAPEPAGAKPPRVPAGTVPPPGAAAARRRPVGPEDLERVLAAPSSGGQAQAPPPPPRPPAVGSQAAKRTTAPAEAEPPKTNAGIRIMCRPVIPSRARRLLPIGFAAAALLAAGGWGLFGWVGSSGVRSAAAQGSAVVARRSATAVAPPVQASAAVQAAPAQPSVARAQGAAAAPDVDDSLAKIRIRSQASGPEAAPDESAQPPEGRDGQKAGSALEGRIASFLRWAQAKSAQPAQPTSGNEGDEGGSTTAAAAQDAPQVARMGPAAAPDAAPPEAPAAAGKAAMAGSPAYVSCPPGFRYSGVIHQPDGSLANINGRFVGVGGVVDEARIVRIDGLAVEMERDGKRFLVSFGREEGPSAARGHRDGEPGADEGDGQGDRQGPAKEDAQADAKGGD